MLQTKTAASKQTKCWMPTMHPRSGSLSSSLSTTWAVVVMAWHLICKGHNNIPFSYMFITDEKEAERRKERENLSTSSWIKLKQLEISWIKFSHSPVLDTAVLFTNTAILNCVLNYFKKFFSFIYLCLVSCRIFSCVTRILSWSMQTLSCHTQHLVP